MPQAVVIGGGVGGLAAAIRLAREGLRVTLIEQGPRVGGKLNLREVPHPNRPHDRPFRFDTGPSLLTLPFVFKDLFEFAGVDIRSRLPITRLDPIQRFVWPDGQTLELTGDHAVNLRNVRAFSPDDAVGFERLIAYGRKIWELSGESFLGQAPEQMLRGDGKFDPAAALSMLSVPLRIGVLRRFSTVIEKQIRHPRLREIFYQYATYSGASPFKAPATLAVIPYCEMEFGGWHPNGGMYRIAEALESVARELGVTVLTRHRAEKILTVARPGKRQASIRVLGVEVNDLSRDAASISRIDADVVICNADVVWAYRHLIESSHRPHFSDAKLDALEPGGSGMCLMLGVEGRYEQLAHHTKFMPTDYRSDLRAMFETRTIPEDPCIYVCAPSRTDASVAPEGCENLFVLCSAPPIDGNLDWHQAGAMYEAQIIASLERRGLTDLSKRIRVRERFTPMELMHLYNANAGAIYGISSNSMRTAFLRPPNRDRKIEGLFFAGGSTHPGGGLPLVALSGKVAASLAMEFVGRA